MQQYFYVYLAISNKFAYFYMCDWLVYPIN